MITIPPIELVNLFKTTPGAISVHEMLGIAWLAEQAPAGILMDIGSNASKAAIAQCIGFARQGVPRDIHLIDTVFDLENKEAWAENLTQPGGAMNTGWSWTMEPDFKEKVQARIAQAGGGLITPYLHGESVLKAVPRLARPGVAFAFCDADNNQPVTVNGIVDSLAHKMVAGGIIAHHDHGSQFFLPAEAQDRLIASGNFERIEIPWEEIKQAVDTLGGEHGGGVRCNSWHHQETERPMFVGAIRRI